MRTRPLLRVASMAPLALVLIAGGCYDDLDALSVRDAGAPFDTGTADAGATPECGEPGTVLTVPGTLEGVIETAGTSERPSCSEAEGPEAHLILRVTEPGGVRVRVQGASVVMALRRGCTRASEIACELSTSEWGLQRFLPAGDYELLLRAIQPTPALPSYPYTLTVETYDAAPNAVCESAIAVPEGGITGQVGARGGNGSVDTCSSAPWPELYYYVDVPPRTALDLRASTTSGGVWRAGLTLANACGPREACEHFSSGTIRADASFANPTDAVERLYVSATAAAIAGTETGTFDLDYEGRPIEPHGFCSAPFDLDSLSFIPTQYGSAAGRRDGPPGFTDERVYYYRVTVGAGMRARAIVTNVESGPDIGVVRTGWSTTCGGDELPEALNPSDAPVFWFIAMSFSVSSIPPVYDLYIEQTPLADHAGCEGALEIAPGTSAPTQNAAGGGSGASACDPDDTAPQLWFRTTLPPLSTANVTATPVEVAGEFPFAIVRLLSGCAGMICEGFTGDPGTGGIHPTIASLVNDGGAPRTFVYSVSLHDLRGPLAAGSFDLAVSPTGGGF
jgi:hypothetical protein